MSLRAIKKLSSDDEMGEVPEHLLGDEPAAPAKKPSVEAEDSPAADSQNDVTEPETGPVAEKSFDDELKALGDDVQELDPDKVTAEDEKELDEEEALSEVSDAQPATDTPANENSPEDPEAATAHDHGEFDSVGSAASEMLGKRRPDDYSRGMQGQQYGGVAAGPFTSLFHSMKKSLTKPMRDPVTASKDKYIRTRERRMGNNLTRLEHEIGKIPASMDAYNNAILQNDKLKILDNTAAAKGISTAEYVGQLKSNPGMDPTGSAILEQVMASPEVARKHGRLMSDIDNVNSINAQMSEDMLDLSGSLHYSSNPDKLKADIDYIAERQERFADELKSKTAEPIAEPKGKEGLMKQLDEMAESMREMARKLADKIASVFGGPKA